MNNSAPDVWPCVEWEDGYPTAEDDDCDPEGPAFECAGYNDGTGFYCPLWGSEECDWECPEGGLG